MSKGSRPSSRIFCTFASFSFTSLSYAATSRTLELPQPQPQQHKIATSLHLLVAHCIQHTTHEHNVYKHAQCIIEASAFMAVPSTKIGRASCRERVCQYV